MAQISGYLPEAAPDTKVSVFKFRETGLTALILETADFIREQRQMGRNPKVLGYREDETHLYFDLTGVE